MKRSARTTKKAPPAPEVTFVDVPVPAEDTVAPAAPVADVPAVGVDVPESKLNIPLLDANFNGIVSLPSPILAAIKARQAGDVSMALWAEINNNLSVTDTSVRFFVIHTSLSHCQSNY